VRKLLWIIPMIAFVVADVTLDFALSDSSTTLHHPRPLPMLLPVLLLGVLLWRTSHQLGTAGRIGAAIVLAGAAANAACSVTDRDGVADYIYFVHGTTALVVNIADLVIVSGFLVCFGAALTIWTMRAWRVARPSPES
jgi:lipoprotein signal peptidase